MKREQYTLNNRMLKDSTASLKSFKKLTREHYLCELNARKSFDKWLKKQSYTEISDIDIIQHAVYKKSAQPKQKQQADSYKY